MSIESLYIISNPLFESVNRYKVGFHTGSREHLISRYITILPDLNIHMFYESQIASQVENTLKHLYRNERIPNINERLSEWYVLPLSELLNGINNIINMISNCTGTILPEIISFKNSCSPTISHETAKISDNDAKFLKENTNIISQIYSFYNFRMKNIPEGGEFDIYRNVLRAYNREAKRKERAKKASNINFCIKNEICPNCFHISIDSPSHPLRAAENVAKSECNLRISDLNNNIIRTPNFIIEIINSSNTDSLSSYS